MIVNRIIETCLYIQDISATRVFYHNLLGLQVISEVKDRHIFFRHGSGVLLCFLPDVTAQEKELPPHWAKGPQHLAFGVPVMDYHSTKQKFIDLGIKITHTQHWREERESFYFEDPSRNVLEVIPEDLWDN